MTPNYARVVSVMDGTACAGFLINRGARGVEAFNAAEKSLGIFPDARSGDRRRERRAGALAVRRPGAPAFARFMETRAMSRERLPNRRRHDVTEIEHGGFRLAIGFGRFSDGRLSEAFINTHKGGTALDTILKDSVILLSFALQAGIDVTTIRAALSPSGPLAVALDRIERSAQ